MTTTLSGAACFGLNPAIFFPPAGKKHAQEAKRICAGCPVRLQCLRDALEVEGDADTRGRHGIYGALTAWERMQLNKRRRAA